MLRAPVSETIGTKVSDLVTDRSSSVGRNGKIHLVISTPLWRSDTAVWTPSGQTYATSYWTPLEEPEDTGEIDIPPVD